MFQRTDASKRESCKYAQEDFNEFVKTIISIESTEPITFLCDNPDPLILNLKRFT